MSTLLGEILRPGYTFPQRFRIRRPTSISHVRANFYIESPLSSGELVCRLMDGETLIKEVVIAASELDAIPGDLYKHGFVSFDFGGVHLGIKELAETEYQVEIEYVGNAAGTIMLLRTWDTPIYPVYNPIGGDNRLPRGLEIYEYRGV